MNQLTSSLICKLGSIVVHAQEFFSADGHQFDKEALLSLLSDHEVEAWIKELEKLAMVPKKRKEG